MTSFRVVYLKDALKQLKKMDRFDARLILSWIEKNLSATNNPRCQGKGLTATKTGEWRYRVGSYRILAHIYDDMLLIEGFTIGYGHAVTARRFTGGTYPLSSGQSRARGTGRASFDAFSFSTRALAKT
ncbi:type II toxin-antitoxin system RelE family toxin [Trueperella pyogenes]|uniref:type II toxin-antitoxin system RelE family toxin n=1 Tax=Trueperella pyogenes TaxID=1661 RepID=UPI003F53B4DE